MSYWAVILIGKFGIKSVYYSSLMQLVLVLLTTKKKMNVFAKGVESAVLPLGWTKCARWSFISLLLINILSFSLFFQQNQNNIIAHVVQNDTAIATNTILKEKQNKIITHVVQDDTAIAINAILKQKQNKIIAHVVQNDTTITTYTILRNNSSLTSIQYLFIVRSDNKNLGARNAIRTSWYGDVAGTSHSWGTSINAKLLFIIEDSQNTTEYAEQDLQFNDTLWIPNSGPRSIESVHFLEVVPTSHYYIIALDTTFINFDNIIHYVEKLGRNYMNYSHST